MSVCGGGGGGGGVVCICINSYCLLGDMFMVEYYT